MSRFRCLGDNWSKHRTHDLNWGIKDEHGEFIASTNYGAVADLIAAAPDLLEACEIAYTQLMGRFTSEDMRAKRIILAAIAKAKGDKP